MALEFSSVSRLNYQLTKLVWEHEGFVLTEYNDTRSPSPPNIRRDNRSADGRSFRPRRNILTTQLRRLISMFIKQKYFFARHRIAGIGLGINPFPHKIRTSRPRTGVKNSNQTWTVPPSGKKSPKK